MRLESLIITALAAVFAGCASSQRSPELARGVNQYCDLPPGARALLRDSINTQIAPNRLELTCAGDAPPE